MFSISFIFFVSNAFRTVKLLNRTLGLQQLLILIVVWLLWLGVFGYLLVTHSLIILVSVGLVHRRFSSM